jgi:PAS domain S-box-containing protein
MREARSDDLEQSTPGWSPSESSLASMLDSVGDGIMVLGPDWRFRYLNRMAAVLLGRDRESLEGRDAWEEFPTAVGHPLQLVLLRAARDRRPARLTVQDDTTGRWLELHAFPQEENLVVLFGDVSERLAAENEQREFGERMATAERIAHFGVWSWEISTGRVRWSDELHRIYGLEPGEFAGTVEDFTSRLHPEDRQRVWNHVQQSLRTKQPFIFEERIYRPDGSERVLLSEGRPLIGADGLVRVLVGVCHDVTERVEAQRALGLSERRMRAILDNIPSLVAVKNLEGRYVMSNAEGARLAGIEPDEVVGNSCAELFPTISEKLRLNDRLAATEQEPVYDEAVLMREGEPRTFLTVTFGLPDERGQVVETCTVATDVTERYERESERRERTTWREQIGAALADERMLVFAQPIVEVATGERRRSELLVRMQSERDESILAPAAFLPAAERFGLVQQIDVFMVGRALELADLHPAVNLSAVTLGDAQARRAALDLLAASPAAAAKLVFEITETAAAEHLEDVLAFGSEAAALGCGLALDDFGTGFGSFIYLRRLPLRYLKIDTSFVLDLPRSEDDQRVVKSILRIAEEFGLAAIAEGVEDEETLQMLRELGADYVQGFHLGRPAPV